MCVSYKHTQHIHHTHGERRMFWNVEDPPANWGATFCAIYLSYFKTRESLMQQSFSQTVTDGLFIGQLHWQTFLVRSCKIPPTEPCFSKGAPIEEICRLEVCAVGDTREGGFWKFRSQSSSRLSHISKLWQLWMHNKMKDQVTFLVTNPGLWLLTSLKVSHLRVWVKTFSQNT